MVHGVSNMNCPFTGKFRTPPKNSVFSSWFVTDFPRYPS